MKIIVIGSKGFIGSHCVNHFSKPGNLVYGADVVTANDDNYFLLNSVNTDFNPLFKTIAFDVCINCSGSANVAFSFESPTVDFELNVINVQKILVAIRNANPACKLINFSSAAVYGNPDIFPVHEDAVTKPLSPYGFHKLQSELLLTEYHHYFGLQTCSLRVFSAFGPGLKKQLFWDLFQKTSVSRAIELFGNGNESRDFIFIDDLMQAIGLVIQHASFSGEAINVANGKEITIRNAVELFFKHFGIEGQPVFSGKEKAGDPTRWIADISTLKAMGYRQQIEFEDGIRDLTVWLKSINRL